VANNAVLRNFGGLHYSDGTVTQTIGSGDTTTSPLYGIVTANKTLRANPYVLDNNTGVTTASKMTFFVAIPITGTPYEAYTADQMNNLVNSYFEGLKSASSVELGSRGKNLFDGDKAILGKRLDGNGTTADSPFAYTSEYIKVKNTQHYLSNATSTARFVEFYNSKKTPIWSGTEL
jgi:hypothetical protein